MIKQVIEMHRILIVEDEEAIRKNIERMLEIEGYTVASASNGQHGLILAKSMLPDLIISDVDMPLLDGFGLLQAVRSHSQLGGCGFILLTAQDDRQSMRQGMRLGADDCLTKPFAREELLEAIQLQLAQQGRIQHNRASAASRAAGQAVWQSTQAIEESTRNFFKQQLVEPSHPNSGLPMLNLGEPNDMQAKPSERSQSAQQQTKIFASILFVDIRHFLRFSERLSATELTRLLEHYFELACKPILACDGGHIKMLGDSLLALFEERARDGSDAVQTHARRALTAACGVQQAMRDMPQWLDENFGVRALPLFSIGIGLHCGEVTISRAGLSPTSPTHLLGESIHIVSRLPGAARLLGTSFVATEEAVQLCGDLMLRGERHFLQLHGNDHPIAAFEVQGLNTSGAQIKLKHSLSDQASKVHLSTQQDAAAIKDEAERNSLITARAAKNALNESLWSLQSGSMLAMQQSFKGYQIVRKLGQGGMSDVFLAWSATQNSEVVLKVLRTADESDPEMLRRFIQEYAVLANLSHRHVARIYDQGFTDEYAYIAMEHLSGGTLREDIRARNDAKNALPGAIREVHQRVIVLLGQIVSALEVIHDLGLVYRDLKPENLMFRTKGGDLVLVDFGIVKNIGKRHELMDENLVSTQHGQVIGTPYYVSPEQAMGTEVSPRSDFYSLGVMLYEMLTGKRAYRGDSLNELLSRHLHAPTPSLPPEHKNFQPLLDSLMAKLPEDRPKNAASIQSGLDFLVRRMESKKLS